MAFSRSQTHFSASPRSLLWELMRGFRGRYGGAIACLFVFTVINYITPLVASATIDFALAEKPNDDVLTSLIINLMGGGDYVKGHLWFPAFLMVCLTLCSGFFSYGKDRLAAQASDGLARKLKDRLFNHLQRLPVEYHDRAETGDLIQRCTSDVETLRLALSSQVVAVSNSLLLLLTALPIMVVLDGRMALASFVLIGPIIFFGYFYTKKVKHLFLEVDEAEGQVTRVVQENITGLRVVRAFAQQDFEIEKFAESNRDYRDRSLRLLKLMAWYWSTSDIFVLLQQGFVLFVGVTFIANGSLTVGTLFAFLMFLNMLLWPVRQMGRTLTELGKSLVALTRIGEILQVEEEQPPQDPVKPGRPAKGGLTVKDLCFSYGDGAVLNGFSFQIAPGETLAIVGPSGAGKSTIMSLLLKFYGYDAGSIQIDGMELSGLDTEWVRSQFSVVMQEPFLYSKTIGENIRLSQHSAVDEEVSAAARLADIHETISGFTSGYATLVGERGVTLSGGQRQRVALARAMLQKTPFLLLDDALSAVDADTENRILEALRSRHGKRTTLVIAHRLSTLAHADQIIVMDGGRIVQHGTHDDLVNEDGLYRRLWQIQNDLENEIPLTD
ncbi:MAG: ABC transporter ATP-binding protein [Verrucomicrobiales bacterium]|nr:ABC transporter ATP-binding protein [Verrucomicrobiales bacterium]